MVKAELGTKRVDPETGKKFYDLGRDPIVSPYTGKSYPISYFESVVKSQIIEPEMVSENEAEISLNSSEFLNLEEGDDEEVAEDNMTDLDEETTPMVDLDTEDDSFLEDEDEDDGTEVKDIIGESFTEDDDI